MLFAIVNLDKPGGLDLRMKTRETHRAYLEEAGKALVLAGPLIADDGETMIGSLLIYEAESLDAARAFAAGDPYAKAGLFASSEVRHWRQSFPQT